MKELIKEQKRTNELLEESNRLKKEELEQKNTIKMLKVPDVAKILGVNPDKAGKLWNLPDFPRFYMGHKQVEYTDFYNWLQKKKEENKYGL